MARRRQQVPERQRRSPDWRRIGRWGIALALFAAMGGSAFWGVLRLTDPTVLPLRVVRIDGDFRHLNRRDIEIAVGRAVQGNFFTLDVGAVRRAATRLPWVEQVSVRRIWPDTLKMTVRERVPLARWGEDGLVTADGVVFRPAADEIPAGLQRLEGPDDSAAEVVERYRRISAALAPLGLQVARLRLDARAAWRVTLADGAELWLGNSAVERRLARFVRVYPLLARPQQRPVRFDLRYSNGMAVRWEAVEPRDQEAADDGVNSRGQV